MSEQKDRIAYELPGVGELRGRPGTSTMELAGMAAFWHGKFKTAKRDGFIAGASVSAVLVTALNIAIHYLRSH